MTRNMLLVCAWSITFSLSCAKPEGGRAIPSEEMIAVWRDTKAERIALAIDLSLGDYPPDGQKNFKNLDEAVSYLKMISSQDGNSIDPELKYVVYNGHPNGNHYHSVEKLDKNDLRKLLVRLGAVELHW